MIHNMKHIMQITSSLAHDMETLYARQFGSTSGVLESTPYEDDHGIGGCDEGDYDKQNCDIENTYLSPQSVHQTQEATNHLEDIGDENFQDAINTPIAFQSVLETQSAIEREILCHRHMTTWFVHLIKKKH